MTQLIVNMFDAKTNLSRLVNQALAGDDVIVAKAGKPVVKLVPYSVQKKPRTPGKFKGHFIISDDFDREDPEINKMFYESDEDDFYKNP